MAEKLFGKLGFILGANTDTTILYEGNLISVEFNLLNHTYEVTSFDETNGRNTYAHVYACLHEAISSQLEELGWI